MKVFLTQVLEDFQGGWKHYCSILLIGEKHVSVLFETRGTQVRATFIPKPGGHRQSFLVRTENLQAAIAAHTTRKGKVRLKFLYV